MHKPEDQLAVVRERLAATPRKEWAALAVASELDLRTIQYVTDVRRRPQYETVHRIYMALEKTAKKPRAKIVKRSAVIGSEEC